MFSTSFTADWDRSKRRLVRGLALLGLLGCLLHWANMAYVFWYGAKMDTDYTLGADSPVYLGMAESLSAGRRLDPMYQERILVPLILRALQVLGLSHRVFPWIVALLLLPTVVGVGMLAWLFTQRCSAAYLAGLLVILYPSAYQYGILVESDVLHLYLSVLAVVVTVIANGLKSKVYLLWAGALWLLAHLVRPALWGIGLVLPYYLRDELKMRTTRWSAALACCGALAVPVGFSISNIMRFGIAAPSLHTAEILFVWTRSRVRAVVESERHGGEWTPLVRDAVAETRRDPRWRILHGNYANPEEFLSAYESAVRDTLKYLREHKSVFLKTTLGEFVHQCNAPFRLYHRYQVPPLEVLYPPMERFWRLMLKSGWWFALCGWAWVWGGRHRDVALLVLLVALLNFAPSSLSCWAGARIRMPTDVLGIAFVAAALLQPMAWVGLALLGVLAYVPRRFFGASHMYFLTASAVLMLSWFVVMSRLAAKIKEGRVGTRGL